MDIKKINVKIILLYSFTIAAFLSPLIFISHASLASIIAVIVLVCSYIAGELYLWKYKKEEQEKEWLHLALINISLSITFLILAIVVLMYGYDSKGIIPTILFLIIYCISGIIFILIFLKRICSNNKREKGVASASIGPIVGAMVGIWGAKVFLNDLSQSSIILVITSGSYFLSIIGLMAALSFYCKFILKKKERLAECQGKSEDLPQED